MTSRSLPDEENRMVPDRTPCRQWNDNKIETFDAMILLYDLYHESLLAKCALAPNQLGMSEEQVSTLDPLTSYTHFAGNG